MWRLSSVFRPSVWLLTAAALSVVFPAHAVNEGMRKRFEQAEKTIHKLSDTQARKVLKEMETYPLQPYLELEWLSKSLDDTNAVVRFMQEHQGTPLERTLRKRWLLHLADRKQAQLFLKNYQYGSDLVLDCKALEMRLVLEKPATVWPAVRELWAVGKSRPDECDPVFERWRKAGQRTADAVWQRVLSAVKADNQRILPYLRSLLPQEQKYLAELWVQVMDNPSLVYRKNYLPLRSPLERDIAAYAMQKLVWKKPDQAIEVWSRFAKDPAFSNQNRAETARQFAIALASKNDPRADKFIAIVPDDYKDALFVQWQLASLLRKKDWYGLIEAAKAMPAKLAEEEASQYWLARAYQQVNLKESAEHIYQQLAKLRSYYGYLAAAHLGIAPSLAHKPVPVSETDFLAFKSSAPVRRMKEWQELKRPNAAKRELTHLQQYGTDLQKYSAAKLAFELGWYDNAIVALAKAGYWDDVDLRFPMAFSKEIQTYSKKAKVDPAWTMAIARRESTFIPTAKSAVGAHGLMQIMPATAKHITGRRVAVEQLYNPVTNIDYGTYYLNYLMKNTDNNVVFATASYNAGFSRVKSWIPKDESVPLDIWVETIPFKETRDYVKNVMMYYQIYSLKMQKNQHIFEPLAQMRVGMQG
jgi:soluble lytic murein transglycosylase